MKAFLVLFVCLFALAFAEDGLSKSEKVAGLVQTEAKLLHKLGALRSQQNSAIRAIFSSDEDRRRQSLDCDSDSDSRTLLDCDGCSLLGAFQNVSTYTEGISLGETDAGEIDLIVTLGIEFTSDFAYQIVSEVQVEVDEEAALILNLGQEAVCETDYTDITYKDDVIRDRVVIYGSYDTRSECLIDSCEFSCLVAENFSQTICGSPITVDSFADFIGDLINELGVGWDSDLFVNGLEDSDFLNELIQFGSENACEQVDDDYPARFGVNFGDSDDGDCGLLFFDALPETGMFRQSSGGRLVAGLGLVLGSLFFTLF